MSRLLPTLGLVSAIVISTGTLSARAYDVDQHFYGTYAMARFAGFSHAVAAKCATYAQWPDETTLVSSPMYGPKIRRIIHFPCSELGTEMTPLSFKNPLAEGRLRAGCRTERQNDLAYEMMSEGTFEGNLMKACTGFHTLEDSFAHSGTPSSAGHSFLWHDPDRPYLHTKKYWNMSKAVLNAMVALRKLLPADAIDHNVKTHGQENATLSGDELAKRYQQIPVVKETVEHNMLTDSSYIRGNLEDLFKIAKEKGYVSPTADVSSFIAQADHFFPAGSKDIEGDDISGQPVDTTAALASVAGRIRDYENKTGKQVFTEKLYRDSGVIPPGFNRNDKAAMARFIKLHGGEEGVLTKVAAQFTHDLVPNNLDEDHKYEYEQEPSAIRDLEMSKRVANMRSMIQDLYGINVQFKPNPIRNKFKGTASLDMVAEPGATLVSMDWDEQQKFDRMILSYIFPETYKALKLDDGSCTKCSNLAWLGAVANIEGLKLSLGDIFGAAGALKTVASLPVKDYFNSHLVGKGNDLFFLDTKDTQSALAEGYKMLLTPAQLAEIKKRADAQSASWMDGKGILNSPNVVTVKADQLTLGTQP